MCGISGLIDLREKKISKNQIKKMNDLVQHRGPDGSGYFIKKNFALAHRRLSIIDLDNRADQPMTYDNNFTIVFNGEIYNYLELKKKLTKEGYDFITESDTEVILASYKKWGINCVQNFNGMWAFAIYDEPNNILFMSRDRFGIKPFYYSNIDCQFRFGSEIKQLIHDNNQNIVNLKILLQYVDGYEENTNETFFENIFKLQPAHNLVYDLNTNLFEIKRYYRLFPKKLNLEGPELKKKILEILENSIKLRMRSDVRVGSCLSGGIDSSLITSLASKLKNKSNKKFLAIHAKSIEKETDESKYAKLLEENLDLKIIEPNFQEISDLLPEVIYTQEEPFGGLSVVMQYLVMKKSKSIPCSVLLDGQGADEVFLGYEKYHAFHLTTLFNQLKIISVIKYITYLFFDAKINKQFIFLTITSLFPKIVLFIKKNLIKKNIFLKKEYEAFNEKIFRKFNKMNEVQIDEIEFYNLPQLLRCEDKNSMRNSIETRLPYLDYRLVEILISINSSIKLKKSSLKYLLRGISRKIVPNKILDRKKKYGFEAPSKSWINKNKDEIIEKIKYSKIINTIYVIDYSNLNDFRLLWRLYNISAWESKFNVIIKK